MWSPPQIDSKPASSARRARRPSASGSACAPRWTPNSPNLSSLAIISHFLICRVGWLLHAADQRRADRFNVPVELARSVNAGRPEQQPVHAQVGVAARDVQVNSFTRGDRDL